jgi:hypothetical protein
MADVKAPDVEEYHVIIDALSRAKTTLHTLYVHKALESVPAPEGSGHPNLLSFLTRGQKSRDHIAGAALAREIAGAEAQVEILSMLLDDYNAREEAARSVSVS